MILESQQPKLFIFGQGAINKVTDVMNQLKLNNPLIISDEGVRETGLCDLLLQKMPSRAEVFSGFLGEPTIQHSLDGHRKS